MQTKYIVALSILLLATHFSLSLCCNHSLFGSSKGKTPKRIRSNLPNFAHFTECSRFDQIWIFTFLEVGIDGSHGLFRIAPCSGTTFSGCTIFGLTQPLDHPEGTTSITGNDSKQFKAHFQHKRDWIKRIRPNNSINVDFIDFSTESRGFPLWKFQALFWMQNGMLKDWFVAKPDSKRINLWIYKWFQTLQEMVCKKNLSYGLQSLLMMNKLEFGYDL